MNDEKFIRILDSAAYITPEYQEYRDSKIKGDLITEDIIKEVVKSLLQKNIFQI